jgi:hypothetical protein
MGPSGAAVAKLSQRGRPSMAQKREKLINRNLLKYLKSKEMPPIGQKRQTLSERRRPSV